MASEPKLWAVFGPDGERLTGPYSSSDQAWQVITGKHFGWWPQRETLKEKGYTCREVRIVPVEEVRK